MIEVPTPAVAGDPHRAPVLRLAGVSKAFGPVKALTDVSLSFRTGEVVGLLGENGAGKSTLLRTLSGDYQPDAGEIYLNEQPVTFRTPRDARAQGVHVVYQEPELLPDLSVAENLSLGDLPSHRSLVSPQGILRAGRELIDRQGFTGTIDPTRLVRDCSPAQRQCVEILKAVKGKVRVLCLDEPTSSLSQEEAVRLWALMERLRAGGTSIIYVSHRMAEINQLCQRLAVMRDGMVVTEQATGELSEAEVIRLMVGRPLTRMFPSRDTAAGEVVVELKSVSTDFVADIDLTVRAGEIVGLAGLVGAGRTEVARAMCGLDRIRTGTMEVAGLPVAFRSPAEAIRAGICLAPEDRKGQGLFLERSINDNISLPRLRSISKWRFVDRVAERKLVANMMSRMRVKAPNASVPAKTLSGGNQQKVLLSRWVAVRPKLLILDEPTRGIDVGAKAEIYHLIDELTRDGVAVVMISSETPELLGLADRIVVMRSGRAVSTVPAAGATEESILTLALGAESENPR